AVSTPVSDGIDATGVGVDSADDVGDDEVDSVDSDVVEQAASEKARRPAAARLIEVLAIERMR
ncbi:hypothetical protein ASE64_14500, partial [Agreia sp. Leaf210]